MTQRALIGDAPRWITWHVVVVWAGIPLAVVAYVALVVAVSRLGAELGSPRPVVTLVVVATLLNLFRLQRSHRPLDTTVRRYYRFALLLIGAFGLMTTWGAGAVVGALLLLHNLVADEAVVPVEGPAPITKEYGEWLERGGDRRDGTGR
jgi:hypothetical protein